MTNKTTIIEKTEPFIPMSLTPVSLQSFTSDSLIGKNLCVQFIRHMIKKKIFSNKVSKINRYNLKYMVWNKINEWKNQKIGN